ncbi:hypothetical protein [Lentibacillus sp. CBA3610]|uniref:hypothetical protein n=1 Tax=Lentibacillus sp. CBA3610 TaxID=2518176 RepID=UPI001595F471|nr:hypothetical protein [Lentibacillus sp. CBA3610]QKY71115.1 hypothetical protein Len3610_17485 [Lentibacillus sp. CBA3610]
MDSPFIKNILNVTGPLSIGFTIYEEHFERDGASLDWKSPFMKNILNVTGPLSIGFTIHEEHFERDGASLDWIHHP